MAHVMNGANEQIKQHKLYAKVSQSIILVVKCQLPNFRIATLLTTDYL